MIGSLLNDAGVQTVLKAIYDVIKIIRIVVPIGLVIMTSLDIAKKVINPEEKDGQKKIMIRVIAAIIVFFVPTLMKLSFGIMGIDIENLNIDTDLNINDNTNNNGNNNKTNDDIDTNKNSKLSSISINNCNEDMTYKPGAQFTLNTNIPSSYTGAISWSIKNGGDVLNLVSSNNKASAVFEVVANPKNYYETITVSAGGRSKNCKIAVEKPKLDSVDIINCDQSKRYLVGDSITLNTSIPATFAGDIQWNIDKEVFKIKDESKKGQITFHVTNRPKKGYSFVKVSAGSKLGECKLYIASVTKLNITNCPSEDVVYHVGDKIHLKSNLPTGYNGDFMWTSFISNDVFKITPVNNGLEAEYEILKLPVIKYGYLSFIADNDSTTCNNIRIE